MFTLVNDVNYNLKNNLLDLRPCVILSAYFFMVENMRNVVSKRLC